MILLTDEEIKGFVKELTGVGLGGIEYRTEYDVDGLLKAQLKKVVEWGSKECEDIAHEGYADSLPQGLCYECWQALLEETK